MARDPNAPALAADYDLLLQQLATMRDEMTRLAALVGTTATQNSKAIAETATASLQDARRFAGRQAHEADIRVERAITENPYMALGLAAGLGLLLGALTRR